MYICTIATLAIFLPWYRQESQIEQQLHELLPIGETKVEIVSLDLPARYRELSDKCLQAAAADADWFLEYVKASAPGKPLPYHPKLGLTKAEYEEMEELNDRYTLKKEGSAKLTVKEQSDRSIVFAAEAPLSPLADVRIDIPRRTIITPFDKGASFTAVHTSEKHAFPWDGFEWTFGESLDAAKGKGNLIRFSVGKLRASGKTILSYSATGNYQGRPFQPIDIVILIGTSSPAPDDRSSVTAKGATPKEESLSNDELERRFIQAKLGVARELVKIGAREKAIAILEDIVKTYPKHISTKEATKFLDDLRKQK